jgi:glycosyltransferase involved in cell wall biosynthesis
MSRDRPIRVGMLLEGNERYGVLTILKILLRTADRTRFRFAGLFLGDGEGRRELSALLDDVCDLGTGIRPLWNHDPLAWMTRVRDVCWIGRSAVRAARAVRRLQLDMLHVHNYPDHLIAGLACRLSGTASVWHWHAPSGRSGIRGLFPALGFAWLADRVVGVSHSIVGTLPPSGQRKAVVVYNGLDVEAIRQRQKPGALRRMLGIPADAPILAILGRVMPVKGHEVLLRAAGEVFPAVPRAQLVVIGGEVRVGNSLGPPYTSRLQELAKELGIAERVHFTGQLPGATDYLCDCDILSAPTKGTGEGLGLVLLEAMAAGVATVSSDCGAPPEFIEHGVTGLLVPPGDSRALADAILLLLNDRDRREAIAHAGRQMVCQRFSAVEMARAMEAVYAELADGRARLADKATV